MNWLDRARREISESAGRTTADTAERLATAVLAVPGSQLCTESRDSIGSNGSAAAQELAETAVVADEFEERAAIMEFEGGLTRGAAERAARELVLNRHNQTERELMGGKQHKVSGEQRRIAWGSR